MVAYTEPIFYNGLSIVATEGSLEIDPWAFLLPLTPAVWCLLGFVLLAVWGTIFLLGYSRREWLRRPQSVFLQMYGVLLQQGEAKCGTKVVRCV